MIRRYNKAIFVDWRRVEFPLTETEKIVDSINEECDNIEEELKELLKRVGGKEFSRVS